MSWLFVVSLGGVFSQECPKSVETVRNKMLTVFSKLIGFCFKVFGMVVLLHNMSKAFIVVKVLLR